MYSRSGVPIKKSHEITKNTIREDEFQVIPELQVEDEPYVSRNRYAFVKSKNKTGRAAPKSTKNADIQKFSFSGIKNQSPTKDSTFQSSRPESKRYDNNDTYRPPKSRSKS